ncbi:MAG: NUDIX hydrolase [Candidatus Hadarchaeales archaeon]
MRKTLPRVGASVLVEKGGKVLLVRRGSEPGKGRWALPGGLVEPGEEVGKAAVREVEEETGVKVRLKGLVGVYDILERDGRGRLRYHYVTVCFRGEPLSTRVRRGGEVLDVRWFGREELERSELTRTTARVLRGEGLLG